VTGLEVRGLEVRVEVEPPSPYRLPRRGAKDGLLRVRGGVVHRLLHVDGERVLVRAAQPSAWRVVIGARAETHAAAEEGIARMRFALGVDDDLSEFHERFRWDPLIGRAIRQSPWRRVRRKPDPFHALAWAVTEQLIEYDRAAAIQRRLLRALGRWHDGFVDLPEPRDVAVLAPAQLRSWDLSEGRAIALIRAAREVASGRTDLHATDHERAWRRLRAIPGIGAWTVEMLALEGQGRYDQLPAGDLGYLQLVGRLKTGNPRAVGTEEEVRELFAPYHPWSGLAGSYALGVAA
jgi:3-methyladenine DNA glycosylase/8-oxoguanine DNA glycosylase